MPKVSVVMSVYNGSTTLPLAIESVLNQTFQDFELMLIDDGSSDTSIDVIEYFARRDERIVAVCSRENYGLSTALNRGISMASGDYIMRMDQDDTSTRLRMVKQASFLDEERNVGLVSCFVDFLFDDDLVAESRIEATSYEDFRRGINQSDIPFILPRQNVIHHGEVMFRKDLWQRVGGYRPEFEMSEDYDLWLRMVGLCDIRIIPEVLYFRRFGPTNASHVYDALQRFTAALAQKAYAIRREGLDDLPYCRTEVLQYLHRHGLMERFGRHLQKSAERGGDPAGSEDGEDGFGLF